MSNTIAEVFASRLNTLMEDASIKTADLSDAIDNTVGIKISVGSLSQYRNGKARANNEAMFAIAKYFHVSADWLLGLTDVRTTDTSIRSIGDYTGLSEDSIAYLNASNIYGDNITAGIIEDFLLAASMDSIRMNLLKATNLRVEASRLGAISKPETLSTLMLNTIDAQGAVRIPALDGADWYADKTTFELQRICEGSVKRILQTLEQEMTSPYKRKEAPPCPDEAHKETEPSDSDQTDAGKPDM